MYFSHVAQYLHIVKSTSGKAKLSDLYYDENFLNVTVIENCRQQNIVTLYVKGRGIFSTKLVIDVLTPYSFWQWR